MYRIRCKSDHILFWSNQFGWTHKGYDLFSQGERDTLRLPIDGEWRRFR